MSTWITFSFAVVLAVVAAAAILLSAVSIGSPAAHAGSPFCDTPDSNFNGIMAGFAGGAVPRDIQVTSVPPLLAAGAPPVTIAMGPYEDGSSSDPGITFSFVPPSSNGSFLTALTATIDDSLAKGHYSYELLVACDGLTRALLTTVSVGLCPIGQGQECTETFWGNINCDGDGNAASPDPIDSLLLLRFDAGLPISTFGCPDPGTVIDVFGGPVHLWGDLDCSGAVNPVDSLKTLRFDAALSVSQIDPCVPIGVPIAFLIEN